MVDNQEHGSDIVANTLKDIDQHRKGCFNAMQSKDTEARINHIKGWYALVRSKLSIDAKQQFKSFYNNVNQIMSTLGKPYFNDAIAETVLDKYQQTLTEETEQIFKISKKTSLSMSSLTGYGESR